MAQHRDQPTQSQPPNDPMGFGGEKRQAGYGKYHPGNKPDQEKGGVPGASGDADDMPTASADIAKGDEVTEEMGTVHPAERTGSHQTNPSLKKKKAA
jgi:hypothetical protein